MKLIILMFLITSALTAQFTEPSQTKKPFRGIENAIGMVHGNNHTYNIQAPKGWVIDNQVWADMHVFAVFYQAGESIDTSSMVGFSRVHPKDPMGFSALIKNDLAQSSRGSKTSITSKHRDAKTKDGRIAHVYSIKGVPWQSPEWIAYIDAPTVVIIVGVSVRNPTEHSKGQSLLRDLVGSVDWINNGMTIINSGKR